jgi:hypothetical protein
MGGRRDAGFGGNSAPNAAAATADSVTTADRAEQADTTDLPPGLSEEGVVDPLALVDARRQTLQNTSYTLSTSYTYRDQNGTVFAQGTYTARVAPGAESYYATVADRYENDTRAVGADHYDGAVWANETDRVIARSDSGGETSYRTVERSDAPLSPSTQWQLLYAAFGTTDTAVVGQVEHDGTTLYKITSTSSPEPRSAYAGTLYDFTALVDSEGVVHSFSLTHETTVADRSAIVTRTTQLVRIGNTTVERPSWYQRAVGNESE